MSTPRTRRAQLPNSFKDLVAEYYQAHPTREEKDVTSVVVVLIKLLVPVYPPAAHAVQNDRNSCQSKQERLHELLSSVSPSILREIDVIQLIDRREEWERLGLTKKTTIKQYRSRLRHLLRWVKKNFQGAPHSVSRVHCPRWTHLIEELCHLPDRDGGTTRMGKFAVYCQEKGIAPDSITTQHTEDFYFWLKHTSGLKHFKTYYYSLKMDWKALAERNLIQPVSFFRKLRDYTEYALKSAETPEHLRAPFEQYIRLATSTDPTQRPTTRQLSDSAVKFAERTYFGFLGMTGQMDADLEDITVGQLFSRPEYIEHLCQRWFEKGHCWKSWHRQKVGWLYRFACTFLVPHYGLLPDDIAWMKGQMARIQAPKTGSSTRRVMPDDVDRILNLIRTTLDQLPADASPAKRLVPLRDLVILFILRDRANRGIDLCRIQLIDGPLPQVITVEKPCGYISITPPHPYRVLTKTRTVDESQLPVEARPYFTAYLQIREMMGLTSPWLMVTKKDTPLTRSSFNGRMRFWSERGGFQIRAHDLRRSLVTDELSRHGDIDLVKQLQGGKNSEVLSKHYDVYECIEASREWNNLVEAHLQDSEEALPFWARYLLDRAAREEQTLDILKEIFEAKQQETEGAKKCKP